jgi:hypothetical protein
MNLSLSNLVKRVYRGNSINSRIMEGNIVLLLEGYYEDDKGKVNISISYGDAEIKCNANIAPNSYSVDISLIIYGQCNPEGIWEKMYGSTIKEDIVGMSFTDIAQKYLVNNLNDRLYLSFVDYIQDNYHASNIKYSTLRVNTSTLMRIPPGNYLCVYALNIVVDNRLETIIEHDSESIPITGIMITKDNLSFEFEDPRGECENGYTINDSSKRVGILQPSNSYKLIKDLSVNKLSRNMDQYYLLRIKNIIHTKYSEIEIVDGREFLEFKVDNLNSVFNIAFIPI